MFLLLFMLCIGASALTDKSKGQAQHIISVEHSDSCVPPVIACSGACFTWAMFRLDSAFLCLSLPFSAFLCLFLPFPAYSCFCVWVIQNTRANLD